MAKYTCSKCLSSAAENGTCSACPHGHPQIQTMYWCDLHSKNDYCPSMNVLRRVESILTEAKEKRSDTEDTSVHKYTFEMSPRDYLMVRRAVHETLEKCDAAGKGWKCTCFRKYFGGS